MTRAIDARLHSAFGLFEVLIDALDDGALTRRLGDLPSNEMPVPDAWKERYSLD